MACFCPSALAMLRKLRNAFAHSAESACLANPAHSARLAEVVTQVRINPPPLTARWIPPCAITSR
jgi:hypothetical protein